MPGRYQSSIGAPFVAFDPDKAGRMISEWCKSKNITTDAQLDAALTAMNEAQSIAAFKSLMKALFNITAP